MEIFFAFAQLITGIYMTLVGFKVIDIFKGKVDSEKEEKWFKKFGGFFKYGGIGLIIIAVIQLL